jgi:hypothetical protein
MSQQFHAWSHMKKSQLPGLVVALQVRLPGSLGFVLSFWILGQDAGCHHVHGILPHRKSKLPCLVVVLITMVLGQTMEDVCSLCCTAGAQRSTLAALFEPELTDVNRIHHLASLSILTSDTATAAATAATCRTPTSSLAASSTARTTSPTLRATTPS